MLEVEASNQMIHNLIKLQKIQTFLASHSHCVWKNVRWEKRVKKACKETCQKAIGSDMGKTKVKRYFHQIKSLHDPFYIYMPSHFFATYFLSLNFITIVSCFLCNSLWQLIYDSFDILWQFGWSKYGGKCLVEWH